VFSSGFPKSQSVEKMILKSKRIDLTNVYKVTAWLKSQKIKHGLTNKDIDQLLSVRGSTAHWVATPPNSQAQIPTKKHWKALVDLFGEPPLEIRRIVNNHHNKFKNDLISEKLINASKKWAGWGTSLKPASEHWILVQKPLAHKVNIGANLISNGVGALNIDQSRIESTNLQKKVKATTSTSSPFFGTQTNIPNKENTYTPHSKGRFPSNFVVSESSNGFCSKTHLDQKQNGASKFFKTFKADPSFIYCKKPISKEKGDFNNHPTVKPIELMRYLVEMITPSQGTIIDPFMGSGTTGVSALKANFKFIGVEKDLKYFEICEKRLQGALNGK